LILFQNESRAKKLTRLILRDSFWISKGVVEPVGLT
jgi:hypothetical protein